MRCVRCNRPITAKPAATVMTQSGVQMWGPVCAKRAGLLRSDGPTIARHRPTRDEPDENQMALELAAAATARQGHRYNMGGVPVIALGSGQVVSVGEIDDQWFARVYHNVHADALIAQPMKYFGGDVP